MYLNRITTAYSLIESTPRPLTVSVGKATVSPAFNTATASSITVFLSSLFDVTFHLSVLIISATSFLLYILEDKRLLLKNKSNKSESARLTPTSLSEKPQWRFIPRRFLA